MIKRNIIVDICMWIFLLPFAYLGSRISVVLKNAIILLVQLSGNLLIVEYVNAALTFVTDYVFSAHVAIYVADCVSPINKEEVACWITCGVSSVLHLILWFATLLSDADGTTAFAGAIGVFLHCITSFGTAFKLSKKRKNKEYLIIKNIPRS